MKDKMSELVVAQDCVMDLFSLDELVFILDNGRMVAQSLAARSITRRDEIYFLSIEDRAYYVSPEYAAKLARTAVLAFEDGTAFRSDALELLSCIFKHYLLSENVAERAISDKAYKIFERFKEP